MKPVAIVPAETAARARYARAHLPWVKRRARRLVRCFGVSRQAAVAHAAEDYWQFVGRVRPVLVLIRGGLA